MTREIKTIYVDHQPGFSFADVEPPIPFAPVEGEHQSVVSAMYAAILKGDGTRTEVAESAQYEFERDLADKDKNEAIKYIGHVFANLGYELKWIDKNRTSC